MEGLIKYLKKQIAFSLKAFGEGRRTGGLLKHIKLEIEEIEKSPADLEEWMDIVILGFDGAWRAGHSPEDIVKALQSKQDKNIGRKWNKPVSENDAILHIKER